MWRLIPYLFGALLLAVTKSLETEEYKLASKIEYYEVLITQYELEDTEAAYLVCAELRDTIKRLKEQLHTLKNKS